QERFIQAEQKMKEAVMEKEFAMKSEAVRLEEEAKKQLEDMKENAAAEYEKEMKKVKQKEAQLNETLRDYEKQKQEALDKLERVIFEKSEMEVEIIGLKEQLKKASTGRVDWEEVALERKRVMELEQERAILVEKLKDL